MAAPSANDPAALVVTSAILGRVLGISDRRIRELRDDGVIPDNGQGRYVLGEAVSAYCAHLRPASGKAAGGGSELANTLDEAKVRLTNAQARKVELQVKEMEGSAVSAEDLEIVVGAVVDALRQNTLALPARVAPLLVGVKTAAEVQDKLSGHCNELCGSLARTELVAAVKDRARRRAGRRDDDQPSDAEAGTTA